MSVIGRAAGPARLRPSRSARTAGERVTSGGAAGLLSFGRLEVGLEPGRREGRARPQSIAAAGVRGAGAPLPYLNRIQAAFGDHDISSARAFFNPRAEGARRALGAEAFTFGNSVALPARPTLRTVAHEAAHIVQQRGGLRLTGGMGRVGDSHERHADAVADLVVQGRSAAPLLHQLRPGAPAAPMPQVQLTPIKKNSEGWKAAKKGAQLFDRFTKTTGALNTEVRPYSTDLLTNQTTDAEEKALGFVEWSRSATRAAERYYAEWNVAKRSPGGLLACAFGRSDLTDPDLTINLFGPSRKRAVEVKAVDAAEQGAVDKHLRKATKQLAKRERSEQFGDEEYDEHRAVIVIQNPDNPWPYTPKEFAKLQTPVAPADLKKRALKRVKGGKKPISAKSAPTGNAIAYEIWSDQLGEFIFNL